MENQMTLTKPLLTIQFNSIEEAIDDIKAGKIIIVVDDANRENEGDFICAAECVTPEIVNFMARFGRGLICTPIDEKRADELDLNMMVLENTALHETAFTISIDLLGRGCTTGISAHDRAKTILALTDTTMTSRDFARPGHIFPLRAKSGGVLRRTGHTEAAIDLAKLAGYQPVGALVEILNEDGTMARVPDLMTIAKDNDLKIITIEDLVAYRLKNERIVEKLSSKEVSTEYGQMTITLFKQTTSNDIHVALSLGTWTDHDEVLVRVQSTSYPSDILGIIIEGLDHQLRQTLQYIQKSGGGALIYMHHMDKELTLEDRFKELIGIDQGELKTEQRDFGVGAQILRDLGIKKINLMTNNKIKRVALDGYDLHIESITPLPDVD